MGGTDVSYPVRQAARTLFVLGLVGVAGSAWLLYFTDWFPVVGGLLGLGGVFAWLAFLANLITDERKKEFQNAFDSNVLQRSRTTWLALGLLVLALIVVAPLWGTVVIDTLGDDRSRIVAVHAYAGDRPVEGAAEARTLLAPRSSTKVRLFTGWFGRETYYVKVTGLPGRAITMPRTGRLRLSVPSDFIARPVVLVRPSLAHVATMRRRALTLEVRVGGKIVATRKKFSGRSFWIGAERDVAVPASVVEGWRAEAARDPKVTSGVLAEIQPADPVAPFMPLPHASRILVTLADDQGTVLFSGELDTPPSDVPPDFPLEIVISPAP